MKFKDLKDLEYHYVTRIEKGHHTADDYINLIILYWDVLFDSGLQFYCINQRIFTQEKISKLDCCLDKLLTRSKNEFPENKEILFWEMFIKENNTYSPCSYKNEISNLVCDEPVLIQFYLYLQCNEHDKDELSDLIDLLNDQNSYRNRYILSHIQQSDG